MISMKVYSEVFGCSSNVADYEIALGLLKQTGAKIVNSPEEADVSIIFTCVVKQASSNRMLHRSRELSKTNKPLIVAGCLPKIDKEKSLVEKINPNASFLGPDSVEKIVDVTYATLQGKRVIFLEDLRKPKICLPKMRRNPVIDIIPIATGCLSSCSYCSIKFARGKLFSYPVDLIVKEAKQSIGNGCKELYITSQDNSCYGADIGTNLAVLLNEICKIEGKFFVRIGMMNPLHLERILDDLVAAYKDDKIFKFLHLPVQSFSSRILKLMKRGSEPETVLEIVNKFYKAFPDLTFSTDIIVGFPTEDDLDFEESVKFIERVKPDIVNISRFGVRPGTEASKLKQLPVNVVNKRSKELFELVRRISLEKNQSWTNWRGACLIDERGIKKNTWIGRNFAYKPIVIYSTKNLFDKFIDVEIIEAKNNYLFGELI